jgi:hypothetical protein
MLGFIFIFSTNKEGKNYIEKKKKKIGNESRTRSSPTVKATGLPIKLLGQPIASHIFQEDFKNSVVKAF